MHIAMRALSRSALLLMIQLLNLQQSAGGRLCFRIESEAREGVQESYFTGRVPGPDVVCERESISSFLKSRLLEKTREHGQNARSGPDNPQGTSSSIACQPRPAGSAVTLHQTLHQDIKIVVLNLGSNHRHRATATPDSPVHRKEAASGWRTYRS